MKVALQPASLSSSVVRRHYKDTIDTPVELSLHRDTLGSDYGPLTKAHPEGRAALWGVVPGKKNINVGKYSKLGVDDYVFFYGGKHLYLGGFITHTFHNRDLAGQLWTLDPRGQAWEYMYSLGSLRAFSVPIEEVRQCLGTSRNFYVQNLYIAEGERAERLVELCNLEAQPSQRERRRRQGRPARSGPVAVPPGAGPTDRAREGTYRTEQGWLRRRLFSGDEGACALCGRELPGEFLVTAHIKKRAQCTEQERRDENVAMLACALGCDRLFEEGYVAVDAAGQVLRSLEVTYEPHLHAYVREHLEGRQVAWHTAARAEYFAWHRTRTFLASPEPLE